MFDVVIIGGGIAGLQAAIQLGRYHHKTAVLDANDGRSTLCRAYHNLLGWPEGVSGPALRALGRQQAEELGVTFLADFAEDVQSGGEGFFQILTRDHGWVHARRLLLATGVSDRLPDLPGLRDCLGISIYVCPDCDGHEVTGQPVVVLGDGDVGAEMALTLTYWSNDVTYLNHGGGDVSRALLNKLSEQGIGLIWTKALSLSAAGGQLSAIRLQDGRDLPVRKAFIALGGNKVHSELAQRLGVHCMSNGHVVVDPRTRQTDVEGIYAAGDVVAHSEQVSIAMGDGAQAAIWIHKSLL